MDDHDALINKIEAFPKYVSRQTFAKVLAKYEIFKRILPVHGSIVECGVLNGAGLMTWAKLSSIFEPVNHVRRIIGFDTFSGFPSVSEEDTRTGTFHGMQAGQMVGSSIEDIEKAIHVYDLNRPLSHIPKVELVQGDMCETAESYLQNNPHLVVALLYLDFDLYAPTKKALEVFVPRMPKGAIIAFDELNAKVFPGETLAVVETLGINKLRIERFPFDSYTSFAVIE
ncbi:MAG: class I SAM-dependent methyltransferase [Magnetococcales bacterium]|nr:class I SAM-dependent methyltransferase [Magnetococcales bacterium]NGZ25652.1 class I SAM-dependent methyltransferase [Magnetococcales bacterium]